ncbi:MAG: serine/threonine-protein kinase, partial [Telluria sp.]
MKTTDMFSGTSVRHPDNGTENCLAIGTRLSDFEITGILGEGGFGIVYVAFDHALQRTVAIKEYMPGALAARGADQSVAVRAERHQETFEVGLRSFINEARLLAQFDHPSLVKVYRFWEQNRTAYTAMQYYDGRTVKNIVENSPELVTDAWCRLVFKQILEALEMLYTMNILHRDVSPDNIMVQASGDAVLLDFGSARQIIGDMTRGLTVILKPGYAPIEQYAGDASLEQGAWTDIYALSALMYFAIVREAPPTSIARMVKDPLTPLQGRALPGFSPQLLAAIDKGLAVLA